MSIIDKINAELEQKKLNRIASKKLLADNPTWKLIPNEHRSTQKDLIDENDITVVRDFKYANNHEEALKNYYKKLEKRLKEKEFEIKVKEIFKDIENLNRNTIYALTDSDSQPYYDYIRQEYFTDFEKQIALTKETIRFNQEIYARIKQADNFGFNAFWVLAENAKEPNPYNRFYSLDHPEEQRPNSYYPPFKQIMYYPNRLTYGKPNDMKEFLETIQNKLDSFDIEKKEKEFIEKESHRFVKSDYYKYSVKYDGVWLGLYHFREIIDQGIDKVYNENINAYKEQMKQFEDFKKEVFSKIDTIYKVESSETRWVALNDKPFFTGMTLNLTLRYKNKIVWKGSIRKDRYYPNNWMNESADYESQKKYGLDWQTKLKEFFKED